MNWYLKYICSTWVFGKSFECCLRSNILWGKKNLSQWLRDKNVAKCRPVSVHFLLICVSLCCVSRLHFSCWVPSGLVMSVWSVSAEFSDFSTSKGVPSVLSPPRYSNDLSALNWDKAMDATNRICCREAHGELLTSPWTLVL